MSKRGNIHFFRKLVADELRDTLFFSTGIRAEKTRKPEYTMLKSGHIEVKIKNLKYIHVNNDPCHSVYEAKLVIMKTAGLDAY